MEFYTTEGAKIGLTIPRQTRNMKAMEIVEYLREHFSTTYTYDAHGRRTGEVSNNKATAYMQAVAKAIFNPNDWKAPIRANHPECGKEWAGAAIIWYHGTTPIQTFAGVVSQGYGC